MTYEIPSAHYDGAVHAVPYTVGADFVSKRTAYLDDGFTVWFDAAHVYAAKIMPGDPLPAMPKDVCQ